MLLAAAAAAAPVAPGGQQAHPLLLLDDFESLHRAAWRVEQGADVEVLLEPTYPWEQDVHSEGTVLVDPFDGLYKAFYVSAPASYPAGGQTVGRMVTLATSADGLRWTRPMLDLVPYGTASLPGGKVIFARPRALSIANP